MSSLDRLRCAAPGCRGLLRREPDGELACPDCGARPPAREYFRAYGARTAQWIVGGAVMLAVGYGQGGALRILLFALGASWLLYALYRVALQIYALRRLR